MCQVSVINIFLKMMCRYGVRDEDSYIMSVYAPGKLIYLSPFFLKNIN